MNKAKHPDTRKILIVDDNPDIHHDFTSILDASTDTAVLDQLESEICGSQDDPLQIESYHYQLVFATQGQQALEMVKAAVAGSDPFLLAFVDMRMPPGWDGLETIERLWQADAQLQIVLCTAYSDHSWQEIQQQLGNTANLLILKKPFDVSEVAQLAATLTEKWRLSKKAATKQETLTYMVTERTSELQETNRQLNDEIKARKHLEKQLLRAQKMEAIGTLAAGVAHDLNNILTGIVSYPDLLLMQVEPENPMYRQLKLIQKSGIKAAAIVQDMLTLGRRGVVNLEPVNLKSVIEEYLQSPEYSSFKRHYANVRIDALIPADSVMVLGSAPQLSKCLMNIVANAAEALHDGGMITIEIANRNLDVPCVGYITIPPGDYAVMSVADTGPGIAEADLEHIFEPFYTKKKMGRSGTGLGLAVVWGVVRDHKGLIDVSSGDTKGTRFDLYLPSARDFIPDADPIPSTGNVKDKKASVLVVDDVAEQREVATALLEALGYHVQAVPSGEAAIQVLEQQSVDLLLLDMVMDPGIDGLETFQQALMIHPFQRAVIASGYTKSDRVEKALALGAASFLRKPYLMQDLANAVREALKNTNEKQQH